ncbi:MAG: hypothetical protein QW625_02860, partial [Candidatus Nanoarchaeia archaeon]
NPEIAGSTEDLTRFLSKDTVTDIIKTAEISGVKGSKIVSSMPVVMHAMKYAGISGLGAYIGAMVDNKIRKVIPKPKTIIIDSPFKEISTYEINYPDEPIPIILSKSNKEKTSFYLASPCKTDLYVKRSQVYCSEYIYKKDFGYVECRVVTEDEVYDHYYQGVRIKIPIIGNVIGKNKDEVLSWVPNCRQTGMGSLDRTIFRDENEDGKWDEISIIKELEEHYIDAENIKIKDSNYDGIFDEAEIITYDRYNYNKKRIVLNHQQFSKQEGKEDLDMDDVFELEYQIESDKIKVINISNKEVLCESKLEYPFDNIGFFKSNFFEDKIYLAIPYVSSKGKCTMNLVVALRLECNQVTCENGKWDEIYIGVYPVSDDGKLQTALKDVNKDGKWEIKQSKNEPKPAIEITDSEGEIIRSEWCRTDAIEITVDEQKISDYKVEINGNEYNFCYAKNNQLISDAIMVGSFFADAFVKRFGGFTGWIIGTAADCTLAYINAKTKIGIWPER